MRKIYSLVLMAAMLLVGTNAWAVTYTPTVTDYASFISAIEGPASGTGVYQAGDSINITLSADIPAPAFTYNKDSITAANVSTAKSYCSEIYKGQIVTLNLNGHNIDSKAMYVISVYYGKLFITGSGIITNQLEMYTSGGEKNDFKEASVILLCGTVEGSPLLTPADRTYLYVGQDVSLMCPAGKCGVYVNMNNSETNKKATLDKRTNKLPSQQTVTTYKGQTPVAHTVADTIANHIQSKPYTTCAYGVTADIYGRVSASRYGVQMSGNINAVSGDNTSLPTYHIYPTADVSASSTIGETAGMYIGGYCRAIIEGTVYGGTGLYVKSGVVLVNNANISSTDTAYVAPQVKSGADASGSGLVLDSNGGYAGDIQVTVTGDSKITGNGGFAIDEKVTVTTTTETTQVDALIIEGGTLEGGDMGAITISDSTKQANADPTVETHIVVSGGNVEGTTTVGTSGEGLESILNTDSVSTTTVVVDGKTTIVITKDTVPAADRTQVTSIADAYASSEDHIYVTLSTNSIDTIKEADLTIDKLTMTTDGMSPKIVVKEGSKLTVGTIQMNATAKIEVQPGAMLIVTGEQGIYAPSVDNLIIQANNAQQATFLFDPTVTSNRQPNATVQLTTRAYQMDDNNYAWHRFTSPLYELATVTQTRFGIANYGGASYFNTYLFERDYSTEEGAWVGPLADWSLMRAFDCYALTNNAVSAGIRYNMKGKIQGSASDNVVLKGTGFNYLGNAYTGPMNIKALLDNLANAKVEGTVWLFNSELQQYVSVTKANIENHMYDGEGLDSIPALQTVVIKLEGDATASEMTAAMNYEKSVWDYAMGKGTFAAAAPQRVVNSANSLLKIRVRSAQGLSDVVTFIESDNYSAEYESGADASKLMNENHFNIYAVADQNLAAVATDDLNGTILSIETTDDVNYTMSFEGVRGEVYALRDNMTNAVVLMNEGAVYNFTAQPNATLEGRFQIVSRQEMPTDVETVEEIINAPKAIYTIMGQYVGETTDWNSLPAGVYVVDGVKIVK